MDISPWIKSSDRRPTRADLPVEIYYPAVSGDGRTASPIQSRTFVVEHCHDEPSWQVFGRRLSPIYTHWRPYRPLTPDQLAGAVEPAKSLHGLGASGCAAFHLIVRAGQAYEITNPEERALRVETVARELEAYAQQKADEAVSTKEATIRDQLTRIHFLELDVAGRRGEIESLHAKIEQLEKSLQYLDEVNRVQEATISDQSNKLHARDRRISLLEDNLRTARTQQRIYQTLPQNPHDFSGIDLASGPDRSSACVINPCRVGKTLTQEAMMLAMLIRHGSQVTVDEAVRAIDELANRRTNEATHALKQAHGEAIHGLKAQIEVRDSAIKGLCDEKKSLKERAESAERGITSCDAIIAAAVRRAENAEGQLGGRCAS